MKVVTGIRRSGKSVFLKLLMQWLREERRVPDQDILYIDKESLDFESIATGRDLHDCVKKAKRKSSRKLFLFVDEVQEIADWEKAIASLSSRDDMDVVVTGSNAHLFSSELATLLSGRYLEFPIQTLSFEEFLLFRGADLKDANAEFRNYVRFGGFPAIHLFQLTEETVCQYVSAIYSTILLKDVVRRHQIRNVPLLENIARYLFDNIGNIFSANRVSEYLRSQRLKVSVETVQSYIGYLAEAQLVYRVPRFDVKGKRHLEIQEKYYLGDIGLRHALLGFREGDINGLLENIIFLDLRRRGYRVSIGKVGMREIDFIATRGKEKLYLQVAYLLSNSATVTREVTPLHEIKDNYPKYVLTMDRELGEDFEGVQRMNIVDFLLRHE